MGYSAPSLFIGAMTGAAYGQTLHHVAPGLVGAPGAYGLIGMGAVFAGAARAPITAVVIMFELTGEYSIILPLMTAIVLATGVSHLLTGDSIYTLKLRRRGIDLDAHPAANRLATTTAGTVLEPVTVSVHSDTTLIDAVAVLAQVEHGQIPVLDSNGSYIGVITARGVAEALADGQHDTASAGSVLRSPPPITADTSLEDGLDLLESSGAAALPVLDAQRANLLGWLSVQRVLRVLRPPHGNHVDTSSTTEGASS